MHNSADIPNTIQSEICDDETVLWHHELKGYFQKAPYQNQFISLVYILSIMVLGSLNLLQGANFLIIQILWIFLLYFSIYMNKNIYYVVTNKRVMVIRERRWEFGVIMQQEILSNKNFQLKIVKKNDNAGSIFFNTHFFGMPMSAFLRIPYIDHVEKLIYNIQNNHQ